MPPCRWNRREARVWRIGAEARAGEPKRLVVLPIGHVEIYDDPWCARAVEKAVAWFRAHL